MRLVSIIAAALTLIVPLTASGQPRWGGRMAGGYQRYELAERGGYDGRYRGGGRGQGAPPAYSGRGGGYGRYAAPAPGARYGMGPGVYGPPPRGAPPGYAVAPGTGRAFRQGQYLPPAYRGGVIQNPGRYRLRTPPPGYAWVGVGPDIYLMQRGSGMVLDTIPGGY